MQIQKEMSNAILNPSRASSSTMPIQNQVIPVSLQQKQFMQGNPIAPIFSGAQISNCTFHINFEAQQTNCDSHRKRRRLIFEDDDE